MTEVLEVACPRCECPAEAHLFWEGNEYCVACRGDCAAEPSPLERVRSWVLRRRLRFNRRGGIGAKIVGLLILLFLAYLVWLHVAAWFGSLVP